MYVRPTLTFVSFFLCFFLHLPLTCITQISPGATQPLAGGGGVKSGALQGRGPVSGARH